MKTIKNHFTFNWIPVSFEQSGRNSLRTALLLCSLLIILFGCGKPSDDPIPEVVVNPTGCAIASDVDQALGARIFEYDDKGFLTKMTGPAYYYGPFVETITAAKVTDAYPTQSVDGMGHHFYGDINIGYTYSGGSGNIYDGDPEFQHQLLVGSISNIVQKKDSIYQYKYDAKKHLTTVLIAGSGSKDAQGFILLRYELSFGYDANDNVTKVKIIYDWSLKVTAPGESRIDYKQTSDELLNITYDDKPSPYIAISKYWKFIGSDFSGFGAYNLDKVRFWIGRCTILSKNNPVKVTGKLITTNGSTASDVNATITYQYNDKNLPISAALNGSGINAFTYKCK